VVEDGGELSHRREVQRADAGHTGSAASDRLDRLPVACSVRIVRGRLKVTAQAHGTTENTEHTEESH